MNGINSVIYTSEIVALIVGALLCPMLLQKFNKRNLVGSPAVS